MAQSWKEARAEIANMPPYEVSVELIRKRMMEMLSAAQDAPKLEPTSIPDDQEQPSAASTDNDQDSGCDAAAKEVIRQVIPDPAANVEGFFAYFDSLPMYDRLFIGQEIMVQYSNWESQSMSPNDIWYALHFLMADAQTKDRKMIQTSSKKLLQVFRCQCPPIERHYNMLKSKREYDPSVRRWIRYALDTLVLALASGEGVVNAYPLLVEPFEHGEDFDIVFVTNVLSRLDERYYSNFLSWARSRVNRLATKAWHHGRINAVSDLANNILRGELHGADYYRYKALSEHLVKIEEGDEKTLDVNIQDVIRMDVKRALKLNGDLGQELQPTSSSSSDPIEPDEPAFKPDIINCHFTSCYLITAFMIMHQRFDVHPCYLANHVLWEVPPEKLVGAALTYTKLLLHLLVIGGESVDTLIQHVRQLIESETEEGYAEAYIDFVTSGAWFVDARQQHNPPSLRYSNEYKTLTVLRKRNKHTAKIVREYESCPETMRYNLDSQAASIFMCGIMYLSLEKCNENLRSSESMKLYTQRTEELDQIYACLLPLLNNFLALRKNNKPLPMHAWYNLLSELLSFVHSENDRVTELRYWSEIYLENDCSFLKVFGVTKDSEVVLDRWKKFSNPILVHLLRTASALCAERSSASPSQFDSTQTENVQDTACSTSSSSSSVELAELPQGQIFLRDQLAGHHPLPRKMAKITLEIPRYYLPMLLTVIGLLLAILALCLYQTYQLSRINMSQTNRFPAVGVMGVEQIAQNCVERQSRDGLLSLSPLVNGSPVYYADDSVLEACNPSQIPQSPGSVQITPTSTIERLVWSKEETLMIALLFVILALCLYQTYQLSRVHYS